MHDRVELLVRASAPQDLEVLTNVTSKLAIVWIVKGSAIKPHIWGWQTSAHDLKSHGDALIRAPNKIMEVVTVLCADGVPTNCADDDRETFSVRQSRGLRTRG